jgi:hypothetical protein
MPLALRALSDSSEQINSNHEVSFNFVGHPLRGHHNVLCHPTWLVIRFAVITKCHPTSLVIRFAVIT